MHTTTIVPDTPGTTGLRRTVPWASMRYISALDNGDVFQDASSMREALTRGGLDWTVRLEPVYQSVINEHGVGHREVLSGEKFFTVREDTDTPLGVVGSKYTPISNRSLAELTDIQINSHDAIAAGMGELDGGRRVFTVVKLGQDQVPTNIPDTALGAYLINYTSHDGTSAYGSSVFILNWYCVNGLIGIVPNTAYHYKIRHTRSADTKIHQVSEIMAQATGYLGQAIEVADLMAEIPVDREHGKAIIDELVPMPDYTGRNEAARTRARRRREELMHRWYYGIIPDDVRWTGWGLMNGISEYFQYHATRRRTNGSRTDDMARIVGDQWDDTANRARSLIIASR